MSRIMPLSTRDGANSGQLAKDTCLALNIRTFLGFVVSLSILRCLTRRTTLVIQNLQSMQSRIKVRTCRSSTIASSSLPSVDDDSYPLAIKKQDQGAPGESNFSDGSEALFSMYLRRAREEDRRMADSWKGYADGMLVFVSLCPPSYSSLII